VAAPISRSEDVGATEGPRPAQERGIVIKPTKLLKAVLKDLGDGGSAVDIFQGGATTTPVDAATQYTVVDGTTTRRHCGKFVDCARKLIAGGTGAKVLCKGGVVDPTCGT
jgi:hypothetical protein